MFLIKLNVVNGGVFCAFLFFGSFLLLLLNCNGIVNINAKTNNKKKLNFRSFKKTLFVNITVTPYSHKGYNATLGVTHVLQIGFTAFCSLNPQRFCMFEMYSTGLYPFA